MAKGMKHHFPAKNVVAEARLAPAYPPLPFSRLHAGQLYNGMPASAPVRIFRDDSDQFLQRVE
jgi:hypothetical protein